MNRKPNFVEKMTQFVTGNGFYLVVLVCVAAIGISGYFLVRAVMDGVESESVSAVGEVREEQESVEPVLQTEEPQAVLESAPVREDVFQTELPEEYDEPVLEVLPEETVPAAESEEVLSSGQETVWEVSTPSEPLVFTWPVNGAVIAAFSVETLLYDETMLDWRTHEGIDLAAPLGTEVLAAAAGTVSEVYEDELMGVTVVIDHGEELVSVYSNLAAEPAVKAGERVDTEDVIGTVGATAAAESGRVAHLHFAMYRENAPVDPEEYLPEF